VLFCNIVARLLGRCAPEVGPHRALVRSAIRRVLAAVAAFLRAAGDSSADVGQRAAREIDQRLFQLDAVLRPIVTFGCSRAARRDDALGALAEGYRMAGADDSVERQDAHTRV
jgi:hypothetical protein